MALFLGTNYKFVQVMLDRVKSNAKIHILTNRVVNRWLGDRKTLSGVLVSDPRNSPEKENDTLIPCEAGFIAIGHKPNIEFLNDQV